MPYYIHFVPSVQTDTLDCHGDQDGTIRFTANGGIAPYQFSWTDINNTQSGSGTIQADGQIITLDGLAAGTYSLNLTDIIFDTTLVLQILEPAQLAATATVTDAACFGACNGSLTANVTGGTAPYQYAWSGGGTTFNPTGLCAGNYTLTVTDAHGCTGTFDFAVDQPSEFIASASEVQGVSCFQGDDGEATVTTNGTPAGYLWNTNAITPSINGLAGGPYSVTVTNADGCTATASVNISTPQAPVGVSIQTEQAIVCSGEDNGVLKANITGPGNNFNIEWSNGAVGPTATNLAAGTWSVTVENEKGCQAEASYLLTEPEEIQVEFTTNIITCTDPADAGIVTVTQVTGGVEPYTYSRDGLSFSTLSAIEGFTAGQHSFFIKDSGGCIREFQAMIEGPAELLLELDNDQIIDLGESVELRPQVNQTVGLTYDWSPAEFLSCADCEEPIATPLHSELFTLTVTDPFGCTASADIYLEVIKRRKVFVPNAFSPNGDGINDQFVPFGGSDVRIIHDFKVFDRQGNMVFFAQGFQPEDYNNAWDGSFKGKTMQAGVFVWFAEIEFIDGEKDLFSGDVTLIR